MKTSEKLSGVYNMIIVVRSVFYEDNKHCSQVFLRWMSIWIKNVHKNNIKILYYDWIDVCEVIDVNKTNVSKECIIYHCWYVLDKGSRFN